jgi:urease accessory protein
MKTVRRVLAALLISLPALAHAHPGHDGDHELTWDFNGGFLHPLTGWDHLLAMIAVGVWAAQLGGRARWVVPSAFIVAMAIGAAFAQNVAALPAVEHGIAASLLVLGLLIASAVRLPVGAGVAVTALFALFHGSAHGAEMSTNSNAASYTLGFAVATALLHATGFALGTALQKQTAFTRASGAIVAVAGLAAFAL